MRLVCLAALVLAGCAVAPPAGTSWDSLRASLYHRDHPEWGRPVHIATNRTAEASLKADTDRCVDVLYVHGRPMSENAARTWDCLWAKGWRWEREGR